MISEITDGVILDYVPDALGSIHSVIDQDANVVKTMRYKPYGEVLSRSGTVADRHYQWVGSYGYRATFAPSSSHYVRARHYSATAGSWSTVDPLWPDESAYGYVNGRVSLVIDVKGNRPQKQKDIRPKPGKQNCVVKVCSLYGWNNEWVTHQYVCSVTFGGRTCSGGLYPGPKVGDADKLCRDHSGDTTDDSSNKGGIGVHPTPGGNPKPFPIKCDTITYDCDAASAVCLCIEKLRKDPPGYTGTHVCWHFKRDVEQCVENLLGRNVPRIGPPRRRHDPHPW
jgi:RHS repeat-associated protein